MKTRLTAFVIVMVLGLMTAVAGESGALMVRGTVRDRATGEAIPHATVFVKGSRTGTGTAADGSFVLRFDAPGDVTVVAHAVGYKRGQLTTRVMEETLAALAFELEEDPIETDQVVITGTRTSNYVKDVAVRTDVVTTGDLELKNATTLFEALEDVQGVRVEQQCQSCNFVMVRMQGLGSDHTQVLVNGQPLYSGLAAVYGLQQFGTNDIDRIEIVKGAGSSLYGSGAIAGAINIVTRSPLSGSDTQLDVQMGSHRTNRYSVTSTLTNDAGDLGVSITALKSTADAIDYTADGLGRPAVRRQDGISDRVAQDLVNLGFGIGARSLLLDGDELDLRWKNVRENRRGGSLVDDYYRNPFTDGTEDITTDRHQTELEYAVPLSPASDLHVALSAVVHDREATNDSYLADYVDTHGGALPDLLGLRPYLAAERAFTGTVSYSLRAGDHGLLFGMQGSTTELEESGMYVVVDDNPYRGQSYRSTSTKAGSELGFFIQDEWSPVEGLDLVPGIRADLHRSREEYRADRRVSDLTEFPATGLRTESVNPRFALKYDWTDALMMRASVGTGYRAPFGFSEDLHLCSGSPRVWKSSALSPERSISMSVAFDYYGDIWRASVSVFQTDLRDKIGFTAPDDAVRALGYDYQWRNLGDASVRGVELAGRVNIAGALDLKADVAFNSGEFSAPRADWMGTPYEDLSRKVSRFPMMTGNASVEYTNGGFSAAVLGAYQGTMYIDYYNADVDPLVGDLSRIKKTEPFMLWNARASQAIGPLRFYAGVENIFNYLQEEKRTDDAAFMYAPVYGTMVYAGMSMTIAH